MRIHFQYKNYPGAPELTAKSLKIGKLTHPMCALMFGSMLGMALMMPFVNMEPMICCMILLVCAFGMPIYLMSVRKKKFAKLDEEYKKLVAEGKIKA